MLSQWVKLKYLLPAAIAYLVLHGLCIVIFSAHATAVSYPFQMGVPLLALAACWRRAGLSTSRRKEAWIFVTAGLLLWTVGMWMAAWEDMSQHLSGTIAYFPTFYTSFMACLFCSPSLPPRKASEFRSLSGWTVSRLP